MAAPPVAAIEPWLSVIPAIAIDEPAPLAVIVPELVLMTVLLAAIVPPPLAAIVPELVIALSTCTAPMLVALSVPLLSTVSVAVILEPAPVDLIVPRCLPGH